MAGYGPGIEYRHSRVPDEYVLYPGNSLKQDKALLQTIRVRHRG